MSDGKSIRSRRRFVQILTTSALALTQAGSAETDRSPVGNTDVECAVIVLRDGWEFCLDPASLLQEPEAVRWEAVQVPHTWQAMGRSPEYSGVAWYRLRFDAPRSWASQYVRVEFEAVTHIAQVFLNGKEIGQHIARGYIAFTTDLSPDLKAGQQNTLLVRVDNRPNDRMLPRNKSYDWTDDGGIIRPVSLIVTPPIFIERIEIDAVADLDRSTEEIRVRAIVRNTYPRSQRAMLRAGIRQASGLLQTRSMDQVAADLSANSRQAVELGPTTISKPVLWHFDSPTLYEAAVEVMSSSETHELIDTFGIRKFQVRGSSFYLNGEKVSLIGVERMAGSHPELGMAETSEWIESNHRDMKELNCVFSRVHWAQDRRVLDFCDHHGILFQEEVPAWGPDTFRDTTDDVQLTHVWRPCCVRTVVEHPRP